jgi:hypothetical protein
MRDFVLHSLLTCLWLFSSAPSVAQSRAGDDICLVDGCHHTWTFIDDKDKWIKVDGTIRSVSYNVGPNTFSFEFGKQVGQYLGSAASTLDFKNSEIADLSHDKDLNLWVETDEADPLRNRDGSIRDECHNKYTDYDKPGQMEFEIRHLPHLLSPLLKKDMRIRAGGWWVQDTEHCKKPELHPVNVILAGEGPSLDDANQLFYYHGLDRSGRFVRGSDESQERVLNVLLPPTHETVRPGKASTGSVAYLVENSFLDIVWPVSNWDVEYPSPGSPRVKYTTTVVPPPPSTHYLDGMYLAAFSRGTRSAVKDQITQTVKEDASGKYLEVVIDAELENGAMGGSRSIEKSRWWFDDGTELPSQLVETAPHKVRFARKYRPATGDSRTTWGLTMRARSADQFDKPVPYFGVVGGVPLPAIIAVINKALDGKLPNMKAGPTTREVLFFQRDYAIRPSVIELCVRGTDFEARLQTIAGVGLNQDVQWTVIEVLGPNPNAITIPPGQPVTDGTGIFRFRASVDPTDVRHLKLVALTLDGRETDTPPFWLFVRATAVSEVGENLAAEALVMDMPTCPVSHVPDAFPWLAELMEVLLKGELLLHKLGGKLPGPRDTVVLDFRKPPTVLDARRRLAKASLPLIHARYELLRGMPVNPRSGQSLLRLAELGQQARWSARPDSVRLAQVSGYTQLRAAMFKPKQQMVDSGVPPLSVGRND